MAYIYSTDRNQIDEIYTEITKRLHTRGKITLTEVKTICSSFGIDFHAPGIPENDYWIQASLKLIDDCYRIRLYMF